MDETRTSIRWRELRLAAIAAVAFGVASAVFLPGAWSMMPFPAPAPVEIVALFGFAAGFVLRRWWVLALPLVVLVALSPPQSGFSGAIIALLVLWPSAAAGAVIGVGSGRWLQRLMLRRALRAELKPRRATVPVRPPAARSERVPVS